MKKIWRKNFEIQRAEYFLLSEAVEVFYKFQKPTVDKNYLKETIVVFENGDNIATYFVKKELRAYIKAILSQVIDKPWKIKIIQDKNIEYNQRFFQRLRQIEKVKFARLADKQLVNIFSECFKLMQLAHGYAIATTWFVDSDNENLSNYLINLLKIKIKRGLLKLNAPEVFSVLTTPAEESLAQKEEKDLLGILALIIKDEKASELFKQEDLAKIESELNAIDRGLRKKIVAHYKKWRWTPYTYIGPAYNLDYYLGLWSSLARQKINPKNEIKRLARSREDTLKKRRELFGSLKLSKKEKIIFKLAMQIIWLKAFRKDVMFYGFYIIDQVVRELGRRQGLSLMQMKYIAYQEIKDYKKFSADELNERYKFSVIYSHQGKIKVYIGQQAKDFLKKQSFEKVIINKSHELKGTPAFVGKVKGRVKIINLPEEMIKMEKGDIMVSHTTFPSLVPAMKKAAAIVTDDGGITCHAAIVARELKIPCVVGTKFATQVLKDGDLVEMDANKGIVRKYEK